MRSAVVLPQPEGPTRTRNSPSSIVERELMDGVEAVFVDLFDRVERDFSHQEQGYGLLVGDLPDVESRAVRRENAGLRVAAVERLELRERGRDRVVRRARGEAEQPLRARLAKEGDRVVGHVEIANPAVGESVRRAAQGDELPVLLEQRGIPGLRRSTASCGARPRPTRPRARARLRRRPSARRESSSASRFRRAGAHASPRSS